MELEKKTLETIVGRTGAESRWEVTGGQFEQDLFIPDVGVKEIICYCSHSVFNSVFKIGIIYYEINDGKNLWRPRQFHCFARQIVCKSAVTGITLSTRGERGWGGFQRFLESDVLN